MTITLNLLQGILLLIGLIQLISASILISEHKGDEPLVVILSALTILLFGVPIYIVIFLNRLFKNIFRTFHLKDKFLLRFTNRFKGLSEIELKRLVKTLEWENGETTQSKHAIKVLKAIGKKYNYEKLK